MCFAEIAFCSNCLTVMALAANQVQNDLDYGLMAKIKGKILVKIDDRIYLFQLWEEKFNQTMHG